MLEEPLVCAERTCAGTKHFQVEIGNDDSQHCLYELLLKIADLSTGRSMADLLEEIAPPLQRITGSDFIEFSLYDNERNCFTTRFWKSGEDSGELVSRAATDSISAWVWSHQQPLVVPDLAEERRFPECLAELRAHGVTSYTALPLTTSRQRFGVLGLGRYHAPAFDPQALEFLVRITRMATLALENQETVHIWSEQRQRLQQLLGFTRELNTTRNTEELMPRLLAGLRRILQHDGTVVALLEEDGKARLHAVDACGLEHLQVRDRVGGTALRPGH